MRYENAPKNSEIFNKIEEIARLHVTRGSQIDLKKQVVSMIKEAATEMTEGPDEAVALQQAVEMADDTAAFGLSNHVERIHAIAKQFGHIRELAGVIVNNDWHHRLDTLAILIRQHGADPSFARLLEMYSIDAEKVIQEDCEIVKADPSTLGQISDITERILTDFGVEKNDRLRIGIDIDPQIMQWSHKPISGELTVIISKWLPGFYKKDKKPLYGCAIYYWTEVNRRKHHDQSSQILLPPDISDSDGAELRLWQGQPVRRLLSEPKAQSLLIDLDKLYEIAQAAEQLKSPFET